MVFKSFIRDKYLKDIGFRGDPGLGLTIGAQIRRLGKD